MIFKTFDSKIDKWTSKIGIFGKSFNELGTAVNNAFKSVIDNLDNFDENVGFWESLKNNLFSKQTDKDWLKNSLGEIISKENIDSYIKELDLESAKEKLANIFDWKNLVKNGDATWGEYFETLKDGTEKYIPDLIKNTNDLSKLTGEDLVKANQQARASALAHNEAIKAQTFSAKAGKVALQALAMAGNMLAMWAISKSIQLATTAINNWIHRVEKANEAMDEAVSEYESAKSSLESINSELEEQNKQIDDLLAKDKLTYAEKGQLEELQAITKELLLQQDIEERRVERTSKEAADKAVDSYNKQYGRYDSSRNDLDKKLSYENFYLPEDEDDVLGNIASYVKATELLTESQKKYQNALKNGEDTTWLADDVQYSIDTVNDLSQTLDNNLSDLQEKRLVLEEEYNKAIEKRQKNIEPLTSSEQDIITTYETIYDTMKMVYEYTNQNVWNNMEIENIFNSEGVEKTKEELAEMAKSGELTPETIASYKNLNAAIQDSELFLKNGQTAAEAFCEQINALNNTLDYDEVERQFKQSLGIRDGKINGASDQKIWDEIKESFDEAEWELVLEAYLKVRDQYGEHPEGWNAKDWIANIQSELETELIDIDAQLSISETIDQLNTQLKPAFDSLKSAYQDIFTDNGFTLENVDLSMLNSIKSALNDLNKSGIAIDYSSFEELSKILKDTSSNADDARSAVRSAFNSLATDIVSSLNPSISKCSGENYKFVQSLLESVGIMNSEAIMVSSLGYTYEEYTAAKEECVNAGFNLADATESEIDAFVLEALESGNCGEALALLQLKKLLVNSTVINTAADVQQIINLASAAGMGAEVLTQLANAKSILGSVEAGKDVSLNSYQKALDDIENAKETILDWEPVEVDFSGLDNAAKSASSAASATQKEVDVMAELNAEMDKIQSAYKSLCDIRDTYNEYGKITVDQYQELTDMGFGFLANLIDENGQLGLNEQAFEQLANAKLQEMQIQLARNAIDTINGIKTETEATEYLTYANENLRDAALGSTEALLYQAQAMAHLRGEQQGLAADQIVQGYEASKMLVGKVEFGFDPSAVEDAASTLLDAFNEQKKILDHMRAMGEISSSEYYERLMKLAEEYFGGKDEYRDNLWEVQEEVHDYLESIKETYNWIENLLSTLSKKTNALIDKAGKFISWQKKNAMINRAVKASNTEILQNRNAYQIYMAKADGVGLSSTYVNKIQNGSLTIEDLSNEALSGKIEQYQEWYDKAQNVLETINGLYDQQRDLIRQKLDNVLDYYSDLDSYLSSVTSKIESLISLNDEMGKRSSLTELVEQFAALSDQIESIKTKNVYGVAITEGSLGDSKRVAEAVNSDRQELIDAIQADIDNLAPDQSGTYTSLLNSIAKTQAQIDKYIDKGWDVKKAKQFDALKLKLQNYYDLQNELDQYATSNTIANYNRVYTAYQKLQNKLDSGKTLSKSEQKKYDAYAAQIDSLREQGASALDKLYNELAQADGSAGKQSDADRVQGEIDKIQSDLENSATYQNLIKSIETAEAKIAVLDEKGYNNLTKSQKKTYDKLQAQLEAYYGQKAALDENATAANIAEYNKIYLAWKKLQDKLDSGSNLTASQWKKYNQYTDQLEAYADDKAGTISKLEDELEEALNPGDKLAQIEKAYEESAKGIYDSYQSQIDSINGDVSSTTKYQNLLAKAQKFEQKKDTKGLTKTEQANLDKYNAELEALRTGGMSTNISDYMSTWEKWYTLQQKLDSGKTLTAAQAKNYDTYKAKLEAWNKEKQDQINDLLSLMEDDLEALQKTYTENVAEAESEVNDYYANLYSLAKQIAEYNITSLQTQLTYLESCISYYKELVSLYDSFSGDKLARILTDLGEMDAGSEVTSRLDLYAAYLDKLQEKYNTTLSEMNEYGQLLDALDTDDFEASMELFNKAMEDYRTEGNTAMADKLQSVLDLLNERAMDADNWGEYADEWANEWEAALSSAKQELISTATEIQEVNDALRQISFENITDAIDELEKASDILSSIESLIQDDWLFEPDGTLSEYGRAKAALLVSQLEEAQAQANEYLKLYNEIQNNKDTYASDKAYKADLNEALQNYYDSLSSAASLENSIMDLMKQNAEEEINSLKDVIEARKKALQAKKDYYDYDKSIKNSQKEIDSLKAQIDALESLSDTTDAATKAKLAQLKAELAEKEEDLQETKDEHTFNLQIDALDDFADSLTEALDNSTKSVGEILQEQKEIIESAKELYQTSTDSVNETLDKLTAFYSGMGTTIDGSDLISSSVPDKTAAGITSSITNESPDITDAFDNDVSDIKESTDANALECLLQEAADKFAALIRDGQFLQTFDAGMFELMNPFISKANDSIDQLNNFITEKENVQPVVINNSYGSLVNVEGNVDRNVARLLPSQLEEAYYYFTNKMYNECVALGHQKFVPR